MKPHPEDPRLTAYLLGELPPEERAEVEYAIATDPAVRLAVEEIERVQIYLLGALGGEREALLPRQHENIRKAAREASRKGKIVRLDSHKQTRKFWVPVAAAAVIAIGVFLLTLIPAPKGGNGVRQVATAADPASSQEIPRSLSNVEAEEPPQLPLPPAMKSLPLITRAVRVEGRLPDQQEVNIQEMLEAFPLRAKDAVAVAKGCTLGVDVLPCPWKPSANLVFISIQGARDSKGRKISVRYSPDGDSVVRHKLLGSADSGAGDIVAADKRVAADERMFIAIEVSARNSSLGRLVWSVEGEDAPALELLRDTSREPSNDARFAALVCGFGLWLREEEAPMVDDGMVLGLAREVAAESLPPDRFDFLEVVDQAVRLTRR